MSTLVVLAIELRLSKKCTREFQNVIRLTQFPHPAFQGLYAFAFWRADTVTRLRIHIMFERWLQECLQHVANLFQNELQRRPQGGINRSLLQWQAQRSDSPKTTALSATGWLDCATIRSLQPKQRPRTVSSKNQQLLIEIAKISAIVYGNLNRVE